MKNLHEIQSQLEYKKKLLRDSKAYGHVVHTQNLEIQVQTLEWVLDEL